MWRQDNTYKLEDFVDVRSDPNNKRGFFIFYNTFVTCVSGRKNWTPSVKINIKISHCGKVSISDEAFAELVLKNYWERWLNNGKSAWTDSKVGSLEFQGWNSEGHAEFNKIYKRIKLQRESTTTNELVDNLFIDMCKEKYGCIANSKYKDKLGDLEYIEEICMDDFL